MSHGQHDPVQHLNDEHAEDLLSAARTLSGHPDATSAHAERVDRYGIDLMVVTPSGVSEARIAFSEPVADADPDELRAAFAALTRRAQAAFAADNNESRP